MCLLNQNTDQICENMTDVRKRNSYISLKIMNGGPVLSGVATINVKTLHSCAAGNGRLHRLP